MEPPPNSDKPVPWSRKAIGWIVLCIGLIAAIETSWTSYHMKEVMLSAPQIALVTIALMAGTGLSLWLINGIVKLNSKFLKFLIGIAAMVAAVFLSASLQTLFREYLAIWMIPWGMGFMIFSTCWDNILPRRRRRPAKSAGDPPKQVGWNPPPENNWWSKYN